MADDLGEENKKKELEMLQSIIDVSANALEGLRTKCEMSAVLTQNEIRKLEGKMIKLFAQQLVIKSNLKNGLDIHLPSLKQWLHVVGLTKECSEKIAQRITSVEALQDKSDTEIKIILKEDNYNNNNSEELSKLFRALHNLRKYTDSLKHGHPETMQDLNLSWDSWDRNCVRVRTVGLSPRAIRATRTARSSIPSEENLLNRNNKSNSNIASSPSVTSINSLNAAASVLRPPLTPPAVLQDGNGSPLKEKKITTPPAYRKHMIKNYDILMPDTFQLTKSKSHEAELSSTRIGSNLEINKLNENRIVPRRGRLATEPGPETSGFNSPVLTPTYNSTPTNDGDDSSSQAGQLQVPKQLQSPHLKVSMTHKISHRFCKTIKLGGICNVCDRKILGVALKCTECKYFFHRECQNIGLFTCGLPHGYLDAFKKTVEETQGRICYSPTIFNPNNSSRSLTSLSSRQRKGSHPSSISSAQYPTGDNDSNPSSRNSSTPSSPAVQTSTTPHGSQKQFYFPDVNGTNDSTPETSPVLLSAESPPPPSPLQLPEIILPLPKENENTASQTSNSNSTDSERTVRVDSLDSQISDGEAAADGHQWPRQNSLSMKEWDIPYDELKLSKQIGQGRFGTVFRGYWHGDVAVKLLNVDYLKNEKTLEQFKMEVSIFRKTRHENLILFMGACMKPPKLAIVTSFSKGNTLYTHIHLRKTKFNLNDVTLYAQQICQGMSYLHAKGIVHKDLKTKNIFLEHKKIVITDFGLFTVNKLQDVGMKIPLEWMCYLAPEIIRVFDHTRFSEKELPFTKASDVYAFGTVWYELLCCEWPFKDQPLEITIHLIGRGMKQSLKNLHASEEIENMLCNCWNMKEEERPDFQKLSDTLTRLQSSKKKLSRSPSHPVHIFNSKSAESVFQ